MKNKKIFRTFAALCTCLMLMGGFSVTAFAQGADPAPTATPAADATNDSNVVVEETEDSPALTPEGNAALVDDFGGNKQLITVTTKAGNYFYILIDRANEDKETAVHFLNQVDEADLLALMEDGEVQETPAVCTCTEKCEAGNVNTYYPVCVTSMTGCTGKEPTPTPTEQPEEPKEKSGNPGVVLALVLFALLGGFVGLALRIDRYLCAVLAGGGNLFHGGTVKAGVVTVKVQLFLIMVHLNISIVFDPSLVFQPGNKDGLVID